MVKKLQQTQPLDWVTIAKLSAPFGVAGWIKVQSFTSPITNILNYDPWWVEQEGNWQPFSIEGPIEKGQHILVRPTDCLNCEQARLYTHTPIAIKHDQLPALNHDEYYWVDLIGLRVITSNQEELGVVDHLFETGANDVLVVKGKTKQLIPFIQGDVIQSVDLNKGIIIVRWSD